MRSGRRNVKKHRLRALQILKEKYKKDVHPFDCPEWPITMRWRLDEEYAMQMASYGMTYEDIKNFDVIAIGDVWHQTSAEEEPRGDCSDQGRSSSRDDSNSHRAALRQNSCDGKGRCPESHFEACVNLHRTRKGRILVLLPLRVRHGPDQRLTSQRHHLGRKGRSSSSHQRQNDNYNQQSYDAPWRSDNDSNNSRGWQWRDNRSWNDRGWNWRNDGWRR